MPKRTSHEKMMTFINNRRARYAFPMVAVAMTVLGGCDNHDQFNHDHSTGSDIPVAVMRVTNGTDFGDCMKSGLFRDPAHCKEAFQEAERIHLEKAPRLTEADCKATFGECEAVLVGNTPQQSEARAVGGSSFNYVHIPRMDSVISCASPNLSAAPGYRDVNGNIRTATGQTFNDYGTAKTPFSGLQLARTVPAADLKSPAYGGAYSAAKFTPTQPIATSRSGFGGIAAARAAVAPSGAGS